MVHGHQDGTRQAPDVLERVAVRYAPRLAELDVAPGFAAAVDQHVAEVRGRIGAAADELVAPAPDPRLLADYAHGFTAGLARVGWNEPSRADYAVCRLTAICWLIREYGL
jgi:hypothetical protein